MNKYKNYEDYYIKHNGYSSNQIENKDLSYDYYLKVIDSTEEQNLTNAISTNNEKDTQEIVNFYNASKIIFNGEKMDDYPYLSQRINKVILHNMRKYYWNESPINDSKTVIGKYRTMDIKKGRGKNAINFFSAKLIADSLETITDSLLDVLNNKKTSLFDKFKSIILFHLNFERIHPFPEGNGRTGRLIMDKMLFSIGLPSLSYEDKQTNDYSREIGKVENDLTNLIGINNLFSKVPETFLKYSVDCFKREISNLYLFGYLDNFENAVRLLKDIDEMEEL